MSEPTQQSVEPQQANQTPTTDAMEVEKPKTPEQTDQTKTSEQTEQTKISEQTEQTNTPEQTEQTKTPENEPEFTRLVGIDFGFEAIVLSQAQQGKKIPTIIQNKISRDQTPNLVAFDGKSRHIGEDAVDIKKRDPENVVGQIKYFLGKKFSEIKNELDRFTFKIQEAENDRIHVVVRYQGEERRFSPEQCASIILSKIQKSIDDFNGETCVNPVRDCTLGVPLDYSKQQQKALLDAATIAGFRVRSIVHELTAFATSYGVRNPIHEENVTRVIGIADMGHQSFNLAIVKYGKDKLEVLSKGSTPVGGVAFDRKLLVHFAELLKTKHNFDVYKNKRYATRLEITSEAAKKALSLNKNAKVTYSAPDIDYNLEVTREQFESLCSDILERIKETVRSVIDRSSAKDQIEMIELVGGGTRIPIVKQIIEETSGKKLSFTLHSSLANGCAEGIALLGSLKVPGLASKYEVKDEDAPNIEQLEGGLEEAELEKATNEENFMRKQDSINEDTANKRNELDSLVFKLSDHCIDPKFDSVFEGKEKESLQAFLREHRDWLDENNEGNLESYQNRIEELKKKGQEIAPRLFEKLKDLEQEKDKAKAEAAQETPSSSSSKRDKPMTKKEKLELATARKTHGNTLFSSLDYASAVTRYTQALGYLSDVFDLSPDEKLLVNKEKLSCYLNLAACFLKLNSMKKVIENCKSALEIEPENVKALFRKATAEFEIQLYDDAKNDLVKAVKVDPKNQDVRKLYGRVKDILDKQKKDQKETFSKMFK
eukprot:TRINITY_DN4554_c0_g4_i1.p1 TRINITY_DN4554_c0_g4~~TRINITY_DN4554_c0_g4_i1.p1  ORF type:complete len:804 (+),score=233.03 TRINITY_DN4554_c0_g4_i1:103-2412(+)